MAKKVHAIESPVKERRYITVLFTDIVRSSEIVKSLDAEEAEAVFERVIESQIAVIKKHGGVVNQVMGDGIMCLFGTGHSSENTCYGCCSRDT